MTKIWAGAIKDADMERYLEIRITESGKVGEVLRAEAGLAKRQISEIQGQEVSLKMETVPCNGNSSAW